jgi:FkbM family methyltransferase
MEITPSYTSIKSLLHLKKILKIDLITIFEFGSRYGEDTIELATLNPDAMVYAFECNPNTVLECRNNLKDFSNVHFTNSAVGNIDGEIDFFAIDKSNTISDWIDGNQGASSLLKASSSYQVEKYSQLKHKVPILRLKTFLEERDIPEISLLWMDVQGAEKMVFEGLGDCIKNVRLIHLEVEFKEIYIGQPLFSEINKFLNINNFTLLGFTTFGKTSADAVYLNKNISPKNLFNARLFLFISLLRSRINTIISRIH